MKLNIEKVRYYKALICLRKIVLLSELNPLKNGYDWISNFYISLFENLTGVNIKKIKEKYDKPL
jgi:hypothetical protein